MKQVIKLTESDLNKILKESINKINEIGDTKDGQRLLGRTAERAWQRAQRTSGADKKRFMKTHYNAYNTAVKSSKKHLDGNGMYYYDGGDYEYEKWKDENDGNAAPTNESKNVNKKLIRLTESDLHRVIKETVNKVLTELDWKTYANAARKARDEVIGRIKDVENFNDLKNDKDFTKRARQHNAFRNQAVQGSREKFKDYGGEDFDLYTTIGPDDHIYANAEGGDWPNSMVTDKEGKTMMHSLSKPKMVNVKPNRYFGYDKDKISDWNQFSKEINDYNSGKSKYTKGKGWK